ASWVILPGLGVRVSDRNRPEPDVLVLPRKGPSLDPLGRDRNDVLVTFEVSRPRRRTSIFAGSVRPIPSCRRSPIMSSFRRTQWMWSSSRAHKHSPNSACNRSAIASNCRRLPSRCPSRKSAAAPVSATLLATDRRLLTGQLAAYSRQPEPPEALA